MTIGNGTQAATVDDVQLEGGICVLTTIAGKLARKLVVSTVDVATAGAIELKWYLM